MMRHDGRMGRDADYGRPYRRAKAALLVGNPRCQLLLACTGAVATSADHDPPLALHPHVPGSGCCVLIPACLPCQKRQGGLIRSGRWNGKRQARRAPDSSRQW